MLRYSQTQLRRNRFLSQKKSWLWATVGNPVSVMVSFEIFARPAILTMLGVTDLTKPTVDAVLVDGERTVSEIRRWLVAEFGDLPLEAVAEYLQALERAG